MNRGLVVAIVVAALVALGAAAYAYTAMNKSHVAPYAPWHHLVPWGHRGPVAHPHCRHGGAFYEHQQAQRHGPHLVLSQEFREHVVEILMSDNRTAALLHEGFNITAIKPIVQGVVEGDGTVKLHVVKAIVVLREKSGDTRAAAIAVVDLVSGKVVKLVEHSTTVWSSQG